MGWVEEVNRSSARRVRRVVTAVRDAQARVRSLGYRDERFKLFVFVVSAVMAGVAGALYVPQVGIINPGEFAPINSIEMVVWVAVGGRGTLYGAALGAFAVNYAKSVFTVSFPEAWLFVLGGLFVAVTLALPHGVVGLFRRMRRKPAGEPSPPPAAGDTPSPDGAAAARQPA